MNVSEAAAELYSAFSLWNNISTEQESSHPSNF